MNGITLRADYGPYIVTAISPTQHFYTDTGLSAAVTLPATITSTTTWYCAPAHSDFYTFTCTQLDGSDISPGVPQWVGTTADSTLNPRPSLAQIAADVSNSYLDQNLADTYREVIPRTLCGTTTTCTSGYLKWSSFVAQATETIASISACVGTTAAGATPSVVRFGLYTVADDGALTLVASTANDTSLLAATNAISTKALSANYTVTAGVRYAAAVLVVTAATAPILVGSAGGSYALTNLLPKLGGNITGQSDLPATVAAANVNTGGAGSIAWFGLTPA